MEKKAFADETIRLRRMLESMFDEQKTRIIPSGSESQLEERLLV